MEVVEDGRPIPLGQQRMRALLAYLLLHANELVSSDRLIEEVWGPEPTKTAAASLQNHISRLRKLLGREILITSPPGYVLRVDADDVDVQRFERLVQEARGGDGGSPKRRARKLTAALTLWRGPALADFIYEPFAQVEIARLEELRLIAIEARIQAELEAGAATDLVSELQSLVAEHPLREQLHKHLMLALYRSGRQPEALEAYRDARRALLDDHGLEPSRELQDLERAILTQDPSVARPFLAEPKQLPLSPMPLIGREREVTELLALLAQRDARLVTLTGTGGVGKTRLALQVAAESIDDYADGVWFVSLAAIRDLDLVEPAISQVVGAREDLGEFLRGKELLLLLDNLEQLLPGVATLVASFKTNVLATSRERLNISGEREYPVPTMQRDDAVALFTQRARQLRTTFEPDEHVAEIARRLDGLPLALELAAARVKVLTPRQIAERLARGLDLLTGGARDVPERHRTLRATIEWSYDLLSREERRLFRSLAVFAGGFDLEAAETICAADLDTLASLVDKSLLRQSEDGRFFMLETIREYALARLDESVEAPDIRRSHACYLLELAELAEPKLRGAEQVMWLDRLEAERDNIRTALDWASEAEEVELGLQLAWAVRDFWTIHGPHGEARRRLERAVREVGTKLPEQRAGALNRVAYLAYRQGDYPEAERLAREALAIAQEMGDQERRTDAIANLANVAAAVNEFQRARSLYEEVLAHARQSGDPWKVGTALVHLGDLALAEGDYERAAQLCKEGLEQNRASGDAMNQAIASMNLAMAQLQLHDFPQAAASVREALRISVDVGDRDQAALCLLVVGALAEARGEPEAAARLVAFTDSYCSDSGYTLEPAERRLHEQLVGALRASLGVAYDAACSDGRELSFEDALELARALDGSLAAPDELAAAEVSRAKSVD